MGGSMVEMNVIGRSNDNSNSMANHILRYTSFFNPRASLPH